MLVATFDSRTSTDCVELDTHVVVENIKAASLMRRLAWVRSLTCYPQVDETIARVATSLNHEECFGDKKWERGELNGHFPPTLLSAVHCPVLLLPSEST